MARFDAVVGVSYKTRFGKKVTVGSIEQIRKPGRERKTTIIELMFEDGRRSKVTQRRFSQYVTSVWSGDADPAPSQTEEAPAVESLPPVSSVVAGANGDLVAAIASAVAPHIRPGVDREQVEKIVDARLVDSLLPRRIETVIPGTGETRDVGVQHAYFEAIRRIASQRMNLWLVGPAGSGKTSVAKSVAESLNLPHYSLSVCALTSKADLIGYRNVSNGEYVATDLRRAYEEGGVFLLDEVDAGNANVMVIMNALLANGHCAFPDRMVEKHPDFTLLAGANTVGLGADKQYVGRNQLDKATVDRFVMMEFPYDPAIEAIMAGVSPSCFAESDRPEPIEFIQVEDKADADNDAALKAQAEERCAEFCRRVVRIRKAIDSLKVRHIVSPRATKAGCTLIRLGFSLKDTMNMAVWKGLDADTIAKVEARA